MPKKYAATTTSTHTTTTTAITYYSRRESCFYPVTPPKTNTDTQNDGLEKVTPLKNGNSWYRHVRFLECTFLCSFTSSIPSWGPDFGWPNIQQGAHFRFPHSLGVTVTTVNHSNLKLLHVTPLEIDGETSTSCWIVLNCQTYFTTFEFPKYPRISGFQSALNIKPLRYLYSGRPPTAIGWSSVTSGNAKPPSLPKSSTFFGRGHM